VSLYLRTPVSRRGISSTEERRKTNFSQMFAFISGCVLIAHAGNFLSGHRGEERCCTCDLLPDDAVPPPIEEHERLPPENPRSPEYTEMVLDHKPILSKSIPAYLKLFRHITVSSQPYLVDRYTAEHIYAHLQHMVEVSDTFRRILTMIKTMKTHSLWHEREQRTVTHCRKVRFLKFVSRADEFSLAIFENYITVSPCPHESDWENFATWRYALTHELVHFFTYSKDPLERDHRFTHCGEGTGGWGELDYELGPTDILTWWILTEIGMGPRKWNSYFSHAKHESIDKLYEKGIADAYDRAESMDTVENRLKYIDDCLIKRCYNDPDSPEHAFLPADFTDVEPRSAPRRQNSSTSDDDHHSGPRRKKARLEAGSRLLSRRSDAARDNRLGGQVDMNFDELEDLVCQIDRDENTNVRLGSPMIAPPMNPLTSVTTSQPPFYGSNPPADSKVVLFQGDIIIPGIEVCENEEAVPGNPQNNEFHMHHGFFP